MNQETIIGILVSIGGSYFMFRVTMAERLAKIETTMANHADLFIKIDKRFDEVMRKLDSLVSKDEIDKLNKTLEHIEEEYNKQATEIALLKQKI
jgi:uncharacterized membrane protein YgaE (UPF0421/DUF939 family)